jgi:pimeloyl-ACP methyl ester carboxylesterase
VTAEPAKPVCTYVLGPTLMPRVLMPRFYARIVKRLQGDGDCVYYAMPELGGFGRTDKIVDALRWPLEQARARRERVQLVGHSIGGVVAWALLHDYPDVVARAELWCAPLRGTKLAPAGAPVAEARFLTPASRFLKRYDRPVSGPFVRSVYTLLDPLAVPSRHTCYVEGETAENHIVSPLPVPRRFLRTNEQHHRGIADHISLPRMTSINRRLRELDGAAA